MTLPGDTELTLKESDYAVDVDDSTTRYTSENSGIVVEVEGSSIAVRSTAETPSDEATTESR